jgi:hypothetical protein
MTPIKRHRPRIEHSKPILRGTESYRICHNRFPQNDALCN